MAEAYENDVTASQTIRASSTAKKLPVDFHPLRNLPVENFLVIWLDANIKPHQSEYQSLILQIQQLVHLTFIFNDPDRCLDFLTEVTNERILLIVSGNFGRDLLPCLRDFDRIQSIYIYCGNRDEHEKWAAKEKQIRGVFTTTEPIFEALRRDFRQGEDDLCSFNVLSSSYDQRETLSQSDRLFIHMQSLKDILIRMEHPAESKSEFINRCQIIYQDNHYQSTIIEEFHKHYRPNTVVRWYTRECFVSAMLNKAFRLRDLNILTLMGFFVRDLHDQLARPPLTSKKRDCFTVYRGQGITEQQFQAILEHRDGYFSFDNFVVTTTDRDLAFAYACSSRDNYQLTGVLFHMTVDPSRAVFTPLDKISYFPDSADEVLFTTQTLFRIHTVHGIEDGLWEVQLRLTIEEDEPLQGVEKFIRTEAHGQHQSERFETLMNTLHGSQSSEQTEIEQESPLAELRIIEDSDRVDDTSSGAFFDASNLETE